MVGRACASAPCGSVVTQRGNTTESRPDINGTRAAALSCGRAVMKVICCLTVFIALLLLSRRRSASVRSSAQVTATGVLHVVRSSASVCDLSLSVHNSSGLACRANVPQAASQREVVGTANRTETLNLRPQIRQDHPVNLSISFTGGKENNNDTLSNGE